jgi:hypothetical protein
MQYVPHAERAVLQQARLQHGAHILNLLVETACQRLEAHKRALLKAPVPENEP